MAVIASNNRRCMQFADSASNFCMRLFFLMCTDMQPALKKSCLELLSFVLKEFSLPKIICKFIISSLPAAVVASPFKS
jgi:hypothetical protein